MTRLGILKRLMRDRSGSAAAETVMIMPLAVMMILAAMEGGFYLYTEHQVVNGVRAAARYAARLDMIDVWNCTGAAAETTYTGTARSAIANVARFGTIDAPSGSVSRPWTWADGDVEVRYACVATSGIYTAHSNGFAPQIAVIGRPSYPSLFGTLGGFNTSLKLYARQQAAGAGV